MSKKRDYWKSFGATATIIGFIVDSVTLLSILLNLTAGFTTSIFANAWIGFFIAILAFVSYFGYLHTFWENNLQKQSLKSRFFSFLSEDLILDFRYPFLILPIIALIALATWLIFVEPFLLIPSFILLFILFVVMLIRVTRSKPSFPPTTKAIIENNWDMIEKRIITDLGRFTEFVLGVQAEDFKDLAVMLDIEPKDIDYALIKFAMLHPEIVEYNFSYGTLSGRLLETMKKRPTKRAPDAGDSAPS
jgi:hypothetical protein